MTLKRRPLFGCAMIDGWRAAIAPKPASGQLKWLVRPISADD
jgi:hypothetical protein